MSRILKSEPMRRMTALNRDLIAAADDYGFEWY